MINLKKRAVFAPFQGETNFERVNFRFFNYEIAAKSDIEGRFSANETFIKAARPLNLLFRC